MAELHVDPSDFIAECVQYRSRFETAVLTVCEVASTKMEAYAKANGPWINRTGNARQTLKGSAEWVTRDQIMMAVAHHMSYGYWLELAHQRKSKILEASVESQVPELYRALKRLVS